MSGRGCEIQLRGHLALEISNRRRHERPVVATNVNPS